jgi:hypothetical protein
MTLRIPSVIVFLAGLAIVAQPSNLIAQNRDFGNWTTLFNGSDTGGWIPASRGQVKAQRNGSEKDKAGAGQWTVEKGTLTNDQVGLNDLCTIMSFENYELELEYRIPRRAPTKKRGDSGLFLRGQIEIQLVDSHCIEEVTETEAGAITGLRPPLANVQFPPGHWNHLRVKHIGSRVSVWQNGVLIQDNVHTDTATAGALKFHPKTMIELDASRGPLMIQGDGKIWLRNILVRTLFPEKHGWKSIWNGTDFLGFGCEGASRPEDYWKVENHEFTNRGNLGKLGRDLLTRESFGNFLLHYEYRVNPSEGDGRSGVYLRNQWEIEISPTQTTVDRDRDGAIRLIKTPDKPARNGETQWNQVDVKLIYNRAWVWQNGVLIHDGVGLDRATDSALTEIKPFNTAPLKFQGTQGEVAFTNIFVRPLTDSR